MERTVIVAESAYKTPLENIYIFADNITLQSHAAEEYGSLL